jgi:hypothetical protein
MESTLAEAVPRGRQDHQSQDRRLCRRWRVELSWAKFLGVALLLASAGLKECAYVGLASNLASALIAHVSVGDGPEVRGWAAATGVLSGLSYFFWRPATRGGCRLCQAKLE